MPHTTTPRFTALDGSRGFAVLMVSIFHFHIAGDYTTEYWQGYDWLNNGFYGVDFFFVLSGFLITLQLLQSRHLPARHYFGLFHLKRALRILPVYYLALAITFLSGFLLEGLGHYYLTPYNGPGWYLGFASNLAITQLGHYTFHSHWFDLGHFWSLAVEEQFYLVWPLIVYAIPKRWLPLGLLGILLSAPAFRVWALHYFEHAEKAQYLLTFCRLDSFAVGGLLAYFAKPLQRLPLWFSNAKPWWHTVLPYAAAGVLYIVFMKLDGLWWRTYVACLSGVAIVLLIQQQNNWAKRLLSWRPLVFLGRISYGIYVYHHLFKNVWKYAWGNWLFARLPANLALPLYILLALTASTIIAWLSWRYLEQPIMQYKYRLSRRYFPPQLSAANNSLATRSPERTAPSI